MSIIRCKRGREQITSNEDREDDKGDILQQGVHAAVAESVFCSPLLELPVHLLYDILSRLPPTTIFCCRCVCKMFFKILTDPYFSKIHLIQASNVAPSLILQDSFTPSTFSLVYLLDVDETSSGSSFHPHHAHVQRHCQDLTVQNMTCEFVHGEVTLVGSCNGLLFLQHLSFPRIFHFICNPILGEFMVLPQLTPRTPVYYYLKHCGFGYCSESEQYKVICFMGSISVDPITASVSTKNMAEIHTVGMESWRCIGDAPCPKPWGSFDSFLNGKLHWITDSVTSSKLIFSFDLESEQFHHVPAPVHFTQNYPDKVSGINVGVLHGHLCMCYIVTDAQFDVWLMKDYGVKESWCKEFAIDIKLYCGLRVEYFHQPIKFLDNGDLLLVCNSNSLVSYSPLKGTFRDLKTLGNGDVQAVAHVSSFISLKDIAKFKNMVTMTWINKIGYAWMGAFVL